MRFEDLRRGHWIVIAILLGAAMAFMLSSVGGTANLTPTYSQVMMETRLFQPPLKGTDGKEFPRIRDIKVYPASEIGFTPAGIAGERPRKSLVTYEVLEPSADGKGWIYGAAGHSGELAVTLVDEPYRPGNSPSPDSTLTVSKYIAGLAKDRPWLRYHYAWWSEPRWMYVLWIGGCVLALGIIWPTLQDRLILSGYGTRSSELPERKEKKESFWRKVFGGQAAPAASSAAAKTSPMSLTQDELDRIAQMEAGLKDFMKHGDTELGGEVDESKATEIRKLSAEPIDVAAPPEKPKEEQDYGGEFYPTVAHGKKKPDAKP